MGDKGCMHLSKAVWREYEIIYWLMVVLKTRNELKLEHSERENFYLYLALNFAKKCSLELNSRCLIEVKPNNKPSESRKQSNLSVYGDFGADPQYFIFTKGSHVFIIKYGFKVKMEVLPLGIYLKNFSKISFKIIKSN